MSDKDKTVLSACKASWNESWIAGLANSDNCSGFFKSVAKHLSVPAVPDVQADGLVDYMGKLWMGLKTGMEARQKVQDGYFVAAGLKSTDHKPKRGNGHIVVVVDGDLYHGKYPMCWCGSIGEAQSQGDLSVGEVWNKTDRDNVAYFIYPQKVS